LEILTVKPVDVAKELRRALRVNKCLPHPSIIINVSSAYCRIGKSCEYCRGMGRLMSPWLLALLRMVCRRSAAKTKRRGREDHPV
jgi:hypothetical protein